MKQHILKTPFGQAIGLVDDPTDHLQRVWARGQFYEPRMLAYIARKYHGGTFIDIGSCIGNHTLFFAKFCADRVISVEPEVHNLTLQRQVLIANEVQAKVQLFSVALGDREGTCQLVKPPDKSPFNVGMWQVNQSVTEGATPMTTLDMLAEDLGLEGITLVKMDTQWTEHLIIAGARRLLERESPALFVELVDRPMYDAVVPLLSELGYHKTGAVFSTSHNWEFVK